MLSGRPGIRLMVLFLLGIIATILFISSSTANSPRIPDRNADSIRSTSPLARICPDQEDDTIPGSVRQKSYTVLKARWSRLSVSDPERGAKMCAPYKYAQFYYRRGKETCSPDLETRTDACTKFHMCVWDPSVDIYISYDIIHSGSFERATVERMARSLDSQRPSGATSPYGLVVDAGANIGQYTLVSAIKGFRTISIEPRPDHVDMIARSLVMNGVENNVQLYQNAIGDVRGVRTFNVWTRNMGGSGFMPVANPKDFSKKIDVDMVRLDDILEHAAVPQISASFFKIDIEGYEAFAFKGAPRFMMERTPRAIMLEFQPQSFEVTGCSCDGTLNALRSVGYTFPEDLSSDADTEKFCREWDVEKVYRDLFLERNF